MSYMVSQMKDMGLGSLSPFQQMQQGFDSTMQDIQNDPFPLLEQYLGRQAQSNIDQTLQPMQQQAQEKISGVMSGIRSLVSEAFPSGGGMSTKGQLGPGTVGGGFNPVNQITQPTSPMGPTTTPPMLAPTPIEGGGGIGLPPSGFNTAFNGPKVPSFMDESGGIGLPPSFVPSSVEYNAPAGLGIGNLLEEPPINLAYNTNMENSPF